MKNKMKFILPKLLGLTVVAGIAVFLLSIVFKLLLAGLILAGIGTFAIKMMGRRRERKMGYEKEIETFLPYHNEFPMKRETVYSQAHKENLAIIPIQ